MMTSQDALDLLNRLLDDQAKGTVNMNKDLVEAIMIACRAIAVLHDVAESWYVCT